MPSNFPPEMLRDVPLFRDHCIDDIEELLAAAEDREFGADETIINEGGHDQALYAIFDGEVEIVLPAPAFQETEVAKLGPGGVFGESSFFNAAPHVVTVRCTTPVLVVRLPRERFDQLLQRGSPAAYKLAANAASVLAERLQATDRWIEHMLQQHQDAEIAASWREFRRRVTAGHSLGSYGPIGTFVPSSR